MGKVTGLVSVSGTLEQLAEDLKLASIPRMTHEEILESRRRLLAEHPQRRDVAPPRVPARFLSARFSTSQPRRHVRGWAKAVVAVRTWVARIAAGDHGMLALIGPKGTGKSHLAACAAWELYEQHGIHVPWFAWYELVDHLRYGRIIDTQAGSREVSAAEVRHHLHSTRVAVLDEIRPTSGTDFDGQELAKFALSRYDRCRSALITCNWARLDEVMGEPAADRFTRVTLVGPSCRHAEEVV